MAASLFLSAFAHILQANTQRAQLRIIRLSALRRGANCRRCFGQWAASVPTDSSTVMADFWFGAFSGEPESSHALPAEWNIFGESRPACVVFLEALAAEASLKGNRSRKLMDLPHVRSARLSRIRAFYNTCMHYIISSPRIAAAERTNPLVWAVEINHQVPFVLQCCICCERYTFKSHWGNHIPWCVWWNFCYLR